MICPIMAEMVGVGRRRSQRAGLDRKPLNRVGNILGKLKWSHSPLSAFERLVKIWRGRRDSNPRPLP